MSKKKKILVFVDWYLPGYKAGGPIRSCANLIEHLNPFYDFYVITRDTDYTETKPYESIESNTWNKHQSGTEVYYLSKENLSIKNFKELIDEVKADLIYINGIYSWYFSILPLLLAKKLKNKVIVAPRGMLAKSASGIKKRKKFLFLKTSKWIRLYRDVQFHATTTHEILDIKREIRQNSTIHLAPNFHRKWLYQYTPRKKEAGKLRLVSFARIAPEKNLIYALEVLQKVDLAIDFDIYGSVYDQLYWDKCKHLIENSGNVNVRYGGVVPADQVPTKLQEYHGLFLPTLGENFGHVILEALLASCLIIISDQTPWTELQKHKVGWDFPLKNEHQFIKAITELTKMNEEEFNTYSKNAFEYAQKITNDSGVIEQYKKMF